MAQHYDYGSETANEETDLQMLRDLIPVALDMHAWSEKSKNEFDELLGELVAHVLILRSPIFLNHAITHLEEHWDFMPDFPRLEKVGSRMLSAEIKTFMARWDAIEKRFTKARNRAYGFDIKAVPSLHSVSGNSQHSP